MAKQILLDARHFRTPGLICRAYLLPSEKDIHLCDERTVHWESPGDIELSLGEVRPDFIVTFGDERLIIEVAVTHFSNKGKRLKLGALQIPAVEVDLSDVPRAITAAELKNRLLDSLDDKSWLYYPGLLEAEEKLQEIREQQPARDEAARRRVDEPYSRSRWSSEWSENRTLSASQKRKLESANRNFLNSPEPRKLAFLIAKLGLNAVRWPSLLDAPVTWDDALGVSRRVWQADVFRRFVRGTLAGASFAHQELNAGVITKWLSSRYGFPPASDIRVRVAVLAYLRWLNEQGYLHRLSESEFVAVCDDLPRECLATPAGDEAGH